MRKDNQRLRLVEVKLSVHKLGHPSRYARTLELHDARQPPRQIKSRINLKLTKHRTDTV